MLLEPIVKIKIMVLEDYMGFIVGDINSCRDHVEGFKDVSDGKVIEALVPLSEMLGYLTDLCSGTQGHGDYSMFSEKCEPVPEDIADKILSDRR